MPSVEANALAQVRSLLQAADPLPTLQAWAAAPAATSAPILRALIELLRAGHASTRLRETSLDLSFGDRNLHLDLLLLPSIFPPEAWGFTFVEGLLRRAQRGTRGKRMVELGTGSGWVSLTLLHFTDLTQVLGVDINPEAVVIARLNAVLNGMDHRFDSAVSDLLQEPRNRGFKADFIVGCIPQVIAPDHLRSLYDFSNYFAAQGLVEDQFGLGLNARALRDSLKVLEPEGRVILNLAGRPGTAVVRRMFLRRGFEPEVLWQSRVQQADDTDIAPLVDLETRTGNRFAFHLHRHSPEPVNARVALVARSAGQPIFHELQVVEGRPRSESLFDLAEILEQLGLEDLWERVDLSLASDEQIAFVARLAEGFLRDPRLPYTHEAGDPSFRRRFVDFLRRFHGLPLRVDEAFAAPSRGELLHALLLCLVKPGDRVVLSASLLPAYARAFAKHGADPITVHDDVEEIPELLALLRPRMVLLEGHLATHPASLARVLRTCEELDCLLLLDASEGFAISSRAAEHPALRFFAAEREHPHLAVVIGLIHSQAFPDVSLGLLLSRYRVLHHGLEVAAELTYSRLSYLHQAYYESLFDELLTFSINDVELPLPMLETDGPQLRSQFAALAHHIPFDRPAPAADVIRLDYGENELPLPRALRFGILKGFLTAPLVQAVDAAPDPAALKACTAYLRATRLPDIAEDQVVLGMGTLPLLYDALRALRALRQELPPRLLLPQGSYALFGPLACAAGCEVATLPTLAPDFLPAPDAVAAADRFDVILLTNPGNPSGASHTAESLRHIVRIAASRGARIIIDEVFGLLSGLDGEMPLDQDRWAGLSRHEQAHLLVLCGASKEFAAGGLRLGFAASADAGWLRAIQTQRLDPLPQSIQLAAAHLFEDLGRCFKEVEALRAKLSHNRRLLIAGLEALGFRVGPAAGGLFLFPQVPATDAEDFVLAMEREARVRMNTPAWSGTERHARACYAIPEARIVEALDRLSQWMQCKPSPESS